MNKQKKHTKDIKNATHIHTMTHTLKQTHKDIRRHTKAQKDIRRHTKTYKDTQRHIKTYNDKHHKHDTQRHTLSQSNTIKQ